MTALREWYAPEQRPPQHPDTELAHHLGNRVMILLEELREVRDENTRLRTMLDAASGEVLRLTRAMLDRGER